MLAHTHARKRRSAGRVAIGMLGGLLVAGGLSTGTAVLVWPDQVEEVYGGIQQDVGEWRVQNLQEVPLAHLGATGGQTELDYCDGTFTEMRSYRRHDMPPIWAAHNNCGGDVILPVELGDVIDLEQGGIVNRYNVVDIRETPKVWVTTEALIGLQGDVVLQSCYYGGTDVPMKFIGLDPVVDG